MKDWTWWFVLGCSCVPFIAQVYLMVLIKRWCDMGSPTPDDKPVPPPPANQCRNR